MFPDLFYRLVVTWSKSSQNQLLKKLLVLKKIRPYCLYLFVFTILTEEIVMCLRSQGRIRSRAVPLGVLIGLALVGALVDKQRCLQRANAHVEIQRW